jgi:hypothetical protein
MAKTDIEHAFRIIPIHPDDHHPFLFQSENAIYVDTVLAMGCASSGRIFEAFSDALAWIAREKLGIHSVHYLGNFLLGSVSEQVGNLQLNQFPDMCSDIEVPISSRKTFYQSTVMTFFRRGVGHSVAKEVCMPQEKIIHCTELIHNFISLSSRLSEARVLFVRL